MGQLRMLVNAGGFGATLGTSPASRRINRLPGPQAMPKGKLCKVYTHSLSCIQPFMHLRKGVTHADVAHLGENSLSPSTEFQ